MALATFAKPASGTLQLVTTSKKLVAIDGLGVSNPPISGSITIASGTSYTKAQAVSVRPTVTGASGAVRVRLVNGTVAGGTWKTLASNIAFALTPTDGARSVAAQFVDAAGNASTVALDDIMLDRVAPVVVATEGNTGITAGADATVHATVADASPLSSVVLRTAPLGSATFTSHPMTVATDHFVATVAAPPASFMYTVAAVDAAGNTGAAPTTAPLDAYRVSVQGPPTSQDLIGAALTAGTIDYAQSLEYRLWSLFSDPQLPDAFVGGGSAGEDTSVFLELHDALPTLDADAQAKLAPYLLRPDNPGSPLGVTVLRARRDRRKGRQGGRDRSRRQLLPRRTDLGVGHTLQGLELWCRRPGPGHGVGKARRALPDDDDR